MTPDDVLFAILGVGFATSIAYVGAELHGRRANRALDRDRLAQQQQLWTTKKPFVANAEEPEEARGFSAQTCCGRGN